LAKFDHVVLKMCEQTYKQTDTRGWKCAVIVRTDFYISYEIRIKVNRMFGNFSLFA